MSSIDPYNMTGRIQQEFKNYTLDIEKDKKGNVVKVSTNSNDSMKSISSLERLWKKLHFWFDHKFSLEDVQRICQRMVRKNDKCKDIIKALDGFVPNPNPNSKGAKC